LVGVLAVLASACRFNFGERGDAGGDVAIGDTADAVDDAVLGHDEDGDGTADASDFCPHIADTANLDGDGDLVGDVCDPQPGIANQSWLLFAPMTAPTLSDFNWGSQWTPRDDDWEYIDAANPAQLIRTGMVADVDVWVGFDVLAIGSGGVQAAIVINGTAPYWYTEIFDNGTAAVLNITEFTGASYVARSSMMIGPTFPLGAVELHLSARAGVSFTGEANGAVTSAPTVGYTGDQFVLVGFGNHSGRVRYIAIVESQ
jgi:hypothetical protein